MIETPVVSAGALAAIHIGWCAAESLAARRRRFTIPRATAARGLPVAIAVSLLIVTAASLIQCGANAAATGAWILFPSALLAMAGIALRIAAIRALGDWFLDPVAVGPPDHVLVVSGVFARMRHPSEAGLLLLMGATASLGGWISVLVAIVVSAPLIVWRTILEDRLLRAHFESAARQYQREVPRFGWCTRATEAVNARANTMQATPALPMRRGRR